MQEEIDLKQILHIFSYRWPLVVAITILCLVIVAWFTFTMTPIYESTTTIWVKDDKSSDLSNLFFDSMGGVGKNYLQNHVEILKSRTIAEKVIARLNLGIEIPSREFEEFRKDISIQTVSGTDIIKISVQDPDPRQASDVANAIVEVFEEETLLSNQSSARSAREFISNQLEIASKRLTVAEDALLAYKQQEGVVAPTEETRALLDKLVKLETQAAESEIIFRDLEARIRQIELEFAKQDEIIVSSQTIIENPLVKEYRLRLFQLETELASAKEKYTDKHSSVLYLKAQIDEVKNKISQEVARIISSETTTFNPLYQELTKSLILLQAERVGAEAKMSALQRLIWESEMQFKELPQKELDLVRLMREMEVTQEIYTMLLTKQEEVRIQEAMNVAGIQVVDKAIVPEKPVKPKKKMNLAIAGLLGLFFGIFAVFVIEFMDPTVKTIEELEELLGLPVIGKVPKFDEVLKRKRKSRR